MKEEEVEKTIAKAITELLDESKKRMVSVTSEKSYWGIPASDLQRFILFDVKPKIQEVIKECYQMKNMKK